MKQVTTINGSWSDEDSEWTSETLQLTGDCWMEVELPEKGRLVIKKAESPEGPYPKALISKWGGPSFRIRVYGTTKERYIKIITTTTPNLIQYANI